MSLEANRLPPQNGGGVEPEWFYEAKGTRHGPISLTDLRQLLRSGSIDESTLVWRPEFGSSWKAAAEAAVPEVGPGLPPALPAIAVTDFYMWLLALTPAIGTYIEQYLRSASPHFRPSEAAVFGVYFLANSVIAEADALAIKKSGRTERNPGFWFWLVPAYIIARARILRRGWYFLPLWLAAIAGSVYLQNPAILSKDTYWGFGLPACDSNYIKNQLEAMINESDAFVAADLKVARFTELKEISSAQSRRCIGSLRATHQRDFDLAYTIQDKDEGILLEVTYQER